VGLTDTHIGYPDYGAVQSQLQTIIDTTPASHRAVGTPANPVAGVQLVIKVEGNAAANGDYPSQIDYTNPLWRERDIKSSADIARWDIRKFLPLPTQPQFVRPSTHYL